MRRVHGHRIFRSDTKCFPQNRTRTRGDERDREQDEHRDTEFFVLRSTSAAFLFHPFIHQEYMIVPEQRAPLLTTSIPMIRASCWAYYD